MDSGVSIPFRNKSDVFGSALFYGCFSGMVHGIFDSIICIFVVSQIFEVKMLLFFIYVFLFLILFYRINYLFLNKKYFVSVLLIKVLFVFLVSCVLNANEYKFLKLYDEENYFHDAVLFNRLAQEHPVYYAQFLIDIEPNDPKIIEKYYSQTNAWYKSPEFFYNDNRWVVKIHSLLAFISGKNLSVHRLFSMMFSMIGWLLIFNFIVKLYNKNNDLTDEQKVRWSYLFVSLSLFPSFFFFTGFLLKENIMLLLMGGILNILYKWISDKKYGFVNRVIGSGLILVSVFFRPSYLLPFIYFTSIFLLLKKLRVSRGWLVFAGIIILSCLLGKVLFQNIFKKNIMSIIQYRQERFLDASRGGIFLLNDKKFVRAPYQWEAIKWDSTQIPVKFSIKKEVPLMYWYLIDLNDTIIELNRDTSETFYLLYYIERANRTVYINPLNTKKSLWYNIHSVMQTLTVFFFYPKDIKGIMDIIVWFESLLILLAASLLCIYLRYKQCRLELFFVLMIAAYMILMISVSSPNIGTIVRYRFFLLPFLFANLALANKLRRKTIY